ncbi:exosortase U [Sulfuriroseicoccus oceanibius]|uniref:Exosortase U n=1 Tax=Sulfuriroseicoccus oceanibius TaxID=2707525 RepID=A0A6B3LAY1_9BACT|nr:exosortase U [Sulfuriroseicoccus oceanibius]QQL44300.1 exosortase U [Sulfuriroseicoccus oceanibius]
MSEVPISDRLRRIFSTAWFPALVLLAFVPIVWRHFLGLKATFSYIWTFAPFVLGAVVLMFVVRWRRAEASDCVARPWLIGFTFGLACLLVAVAEVYKILWFAHVGWIFVLGAGALSLSAKRQVPGFLGLWMLLLLLLRLPPQVDLLIVNFQHHASTQVASRILDFLGYFHVVKESVLELPGAELPLDGICNGQYALMAMVTASAMVCVWRQRKAFHTLLVMLSGLLWGGVLNVLSVVVTTVAYMRFEANLTEGIAGSITAVLIFVVCALGVYSTDALFSVLTQKVPNVPTVRMWRRRHVTNPLPVFWNWLTSFSIPGHWFFKTRDDSEVGRARRARRSMIFRVGFAFVLVGLVALQMVVAFYARKVGAHTRMASEEELMRFPQEVVSFERPGWEVLAYKRNERPMGSVWGRWSDVWTLKYNRRTIVMAVDYAFSNWHDVNRCYGNIGWLLTENKVISELSSTGDWKASQSRMVVPSGENAYILCSHCDQSGIPVEPRPDATNLMAVIYRLEPRRMVMPFGPELSKDERTFYQTQMMVRSRDQLSPEEELEIQAMYDQFRMQVRARLQARRGS